MINQNKAHILVADDYEVNRKITQLQLQKAGYVVDLVENGQQAVELPPNPIRSDPDGYSDAHHGWFESNGRN
jgi:response regulator RpfG family c-di-GMP phosphodiesterase